MTLETQRRHVARVSVVTRHMIWVIAIDLEQPDVRVTRCSDVFLVGRDLETINLLQYTNQYKY